MLKIFVKNTFLGVPVPLTEGGDRIPDNTESTNLKKDKIALIAKSLSLELARQKHRLAAQLVRYYLKFPKIDLSTFFCLGI